jgi:hypothetical protein
MRCIVVAGQPGCSADGQTIRKSDAEKITARCEGTVLVTVAKAYYGRFDCAAVGAVCKSNGDAALCAFATDDCTPWDPDVDICDGDGHTIRVCVGGKRVSFDCASIGARCAVPSDATYATCTK